MDTIRNYIQLIEDIENNTYVESILSLYDDYSSLDELLDGEDLPDIIEELVDNDMTNEFKFLMEHLDIDYEKHSSHSNNDYLLVLNNGISIEFPHKTVHDDPDDVIYGWNDTDVLAFFNYDQHAWSNKFWNSITGTTYVYHATHEGKWDSIKENGIEARNESRGLTNRGTASAVFVTTEQDDLFNGTYGDVHLRIDLFKMKQDNYTPLITEEEPWIVDQYRGTLSSFFDKEYSADSGDGISPSTLVIFDNIPIKYIQRID